MARNTSSLANSNRRASMTLYSDPECPWSHRARIVLHEKQISADIEEISDGQWPEDIAAANPYGAKPALSDKGLVLFDADIIINYFEERFVLPALLPRAPADRAQMRLMLHRIEKDWYSLWPHLTGREKNKAAKARKTIQEDLTVLAPVFAHSNYFMNNEFSLLDCAIAPLLWRLPSLKITLPTSAIAVEKYAQRIFARDSFQASLSDFERRMR